MRHRGHPTSRPMVQRSENSLSSTQSHSEDMQPVQAEEAGVSQPCSQ